MRGKAQMWFQAQASLWICALRWIVPEDTGKKIWTYVWPKGGKEFIQVNMSFCNNIEVVNPVSLNCDWYRLLRPHNSMKTASVNV